MPTVSRKPNPGTNVVQSYIFPADWTRDQVVFWLGENDAFAGGIEQTESSWRARQYNPEDFVEGSFRMIRVGSRGVRAVRGQAKGRKRDALEERGDQGKPPPGVLAVQTIIFPAEWSRDRAVQWLRRNEYSAAELGRDSPDKAWRARQYAPHYFVPGSFNRKKVREKGKSEEPENRSRTAEVLLVLARSKG
jgi:hypothetical protein